MSQVIFTFAVSKADKTNLAMVTKLKTLSAKTGVTFTHLVLSALKDYEGKIHDRAKK